jgi:hypothetical protein
MLIRLWRSCAAQEAAQKIQKYTRVLERGHVPKARKDMQLRARYRSGRAMDVQSDGMDPPAFLSVGIAGRSPLPRMSLEEDER